MEFHIEYETVEPYKELIIQNEKVMADEPKAKLRADKEKKPNYFKKLLFTKIKRFYLIKPMNYTILSPMNLCPECQNANPDGSKFCIQCGVALTSKNSKKTTFTLSEINDKGVELKSVPFEEGYNFSKSKDFVDFNAKKNKVEIKSEKDKLFIKDNGSSGVYIKIPNSQAIELGIGQEFILDGKQFKVS